MTTEIESATPADAQAEQVQQVEQVQGEEATTAQAQEQNTEESAEDKAKREPWFQKRIGELTREKYEAKRQADAAAQEASDLRAQIARQQQGETFEANPDSVDALAEQKATQLFAERSFNESCNRVHAAGVKEFPDFQKAMANLHMVGINRDFLELATTSDAGAKLLHHLGNDLDEAARITALPPVQMARELTRLEYKLAQAPAVKPVSNAPAPVRPIGSGAVSAADPSKMSDAEWHEREYLKRRTK
jgi:hypothetical protein